MGVDPSTYSSTEYSVLKDMGARGKSIQWASGSLPGGLGGWPVHGEFLGPTAALGVAIRQGMYLYSIKCMYMYMVVKYCGLMCSVVYIVSSR